MVSANTVTNVFHERIIKIDVDIHGLYSHKKKRKKTESQKLIVLEKLKRKACENRNILTLELLLEFILNRGKTSNVALTVHKKDSTRKIA